MTGMWQSFWIDEEGAEGEEREGWAGAPPKEEVEDEGKEKGRRRQGLWQPDDVNVLLSPLRHFFSNFSKFICSAVKKKPFE